MQTMLFMARGDIGLRLKDILGARKMKPADLVKVSGGEVSHARLNNWLSGTSDPKTDILPSLAHWIGVPISALLGESGVPVAQPDRRDGERMLTPAPTGWIKMAGRIGAGSAPEASSGDESMEVAISFASPNHTGVVAEGTSMLPYIHPGDTLVFRDSLVERLGKIVAVRLESDPSAPLVKKLVYEENRWLLRSFNTSQPDIEEPFRMIGVLIGLISINGELTVGPEYGGIDENYLRNAFSSRLP